MHLYPESQIDKLRKMPEPKELSEQFADEINRFTIEIESLATSFPTIMLIAQAMSQNAQEELKKFLEKNATGSKDEGERRTYTLTGDASAKAARLQRKTVNAHRAFILLHRSFLTSMVSQYDSFIGRLLRLIFLAKPEILNASEKEMTFADLTKFDSIQAARDYIVEKEVESIIRKSHSDHFAWLERVLAVNLCVYLVAWLPFIVLILRRILFVHCDGIAVMPTTIVTNLQPPNDDTLAQTLLGCIAGKFGEKLIEEALKKANSKVLEKLLTHISQINFTSRS